MYEFALKKMKGLGAPIGKAKKSDVNKTVGIEEVYATYFDKISESDLMDSIYDNDFQIYERLMNSLTDASHYIESGEYSYASECLSDFTRILDEINSDWDIEQFDLDELVEIQRKLLATGKSKSKKSEVKKMSPFDEFIRNSNFWTPSVEIESIERDPYRDDGRIITFRITDDYDYTTSEDDEDFGRMIDNLYDRSENVRGMSTAGFADALDDKRFKWHVYDDRVDANY